MDFLNDYFTYKNGVKICGLTPELNCFYILNFFEKKAKSIIVVTNSLYQANNLYNLFQNHIENVYLFPMDDFLSSIAIAESPELKLTRLETLKKIKQCKCIVITNLMGYLRYLPSKSINYELELVVNQKVNRTDILSKFENLGYTKETVVTSTGEYAVRGYIIDIFPVTSKYPYRIEFFDNQIESIRQFDPSTQMSIKNINKIIVNPIKEIVNQSVSSLLDYTDGPVIFVDYSQIKAGYTQLQNDIMEYNISKSLDKNYMYNIEDINPKYLIYLNTLDQINEKDSIIINSKEIDNYNMNFMKLKSDILKYNSLGKEVILCYTNNAQYKKLKELDLKVRLLNIKVNKGFIIGKYVIIGEHDLENTNNNVEKYKKSYSFGKRIKDYTQLKQGDYIVHVSHGIGIYNGLVELSKNGVKKDYLQLLYADNDKVYVPVEKIKTIYKYSDKEGIKPKINRLNSSSWMRTKKYVGQKIKDISAKLMELYSERLKIKNEKYRIYPEQEIFNSEFTYELTSDQQKSINDIFNDLQSSYPMDRLLCGDVGFGKTEVAFRAIFATILNNKQVMYLCPTTILSKQQYEVAVKRFSNWPIKIALLNRFTSVKNATQIINELKEGKIDLVFGTHRLLSSDVVFKNIGLLVIDEEQRFGVTHKEKIKALKKDINVLTLSATPIPRTLKMALSGIRDLSIIDTPPVDRYPVQTYVIDENDLIIKDAIYKELSRNGQIFVLYNSVERIEKKLWQLQQLIPDAKINYAHGQMPKEQLENIMTDFIEHKYDILLCTTIIESGIDIPNTNTLIVYDADKFGLSQLYQIRGRVGRSNRIAYCYLLYKGNKILNEIAYKRLQSIKEFTELGSGYKIAMRDLSIRGAGDIFGASQAGFIDTLGISLYMKMIDDEIKRQKGEMVLDDDIDDSVLLNVETHIDDDYVFDEELKIEIHQKISEICSEESFLDIKKEFEDRFGIIPKKLEIYMYEEWFESLARKYEIKNVIQNNRYIQFEFSENISAKIEGDKLLITAFQINHNFKLKYERNRIVVVLFLNNLEKNFIIYLVNLLSSLELK